MMGRVSFALALLCVACDALALREDISAAIAQAEDIADDIINHDNGPTVNPPVDTNAPKVEAMPNFGDNEPNEWDQVYPVAEPAGPLAVDADIEKVAKIPKVTDASLEADAGTVKVSRDQGIHPMEEKTPLPVQGYFKDMCDGNTVLNVTVPAAVGGVLPPQYGCFGEKEFAREKASPAVIWENVYEDVISFSLQVVSMGGEDCPGPYSGDPAAGKILWDVIDIQPKGRVVIPEGASHDLRTLNGGKEQPNQWLEEYYSGPCPDTEKTECFRFMVVGHRGEGKKCQCGHADVTFTRPAAPFDESTEFVYKGTVYDSEAPLEDPAAELAAQDAAIAMEEAPAATEEAAPVTQPTPTEEAVVTVPVAEDEKSAGETEGATAEDAEKQKKL